jgi:hypothetical protein
MAVTTNYSTPVMVNGFSCKNCTDVDYAKKHIDPAHPKSGPYGIDAKSDPSVQQTTASDAVTFGGSLRNTGQMSAGTSGTVNALSSGAVGAQLDISA